MEKNYRILAINPGSTSSKIALYDGESQVFTQVLRHDKTELDSLGDVLEQKSFRYRAVTRALEEHKIDLHTIDAIVGRGGIIRPLAGGVYTVSEDMTKDLLGRYPLALSHPCGLGGLIAKEIGDTIGKPSFVVDPVVVDEFEPVARISGWDKIERKSIFHALNQKAIARKVANDLGKPYESLKLVVAHIGGGVSVGAHKYGRVVDVNDAINGEGPFSPERSGGLPVVALVEACFSGEYTKEQLKSLATKNGGMASYIGTSNCIECEQMIAQGNETAALVYEAMAYQISKEIGGMIAVLEGEADAIVLTGGITYSKMFTQLISKYIHRLAQVLVYPGEDEMLALVSGTLEVLKGEREVLQYIV